MPLISIIIPTYNRSHVLPDALLSAVDQKDANIELIVIDDGSTDCTKEIVKEYDFPIRYFFQANQGTSAARNEGLAKASGEYVVFLDSDDLLLPHKAHVQSRMLMEHSENSVIYSRWKTSALDGTILREAGEDATPNLIPTLLCRNIAALHSCLFRTEALREIGGFDPNLSIIEDWDLLLRLALHGYNFAFLPDVTAVYRMHSQNITHDRKAALEQSLKFTDKMLRYCELPHKYRDYSSHLKCLRYLETIRRYFVYHQVEDALTLIKTMCISVPVAADWLLSLHVEEKTIQHAIKSEALSDAFLEHVAPNMINELRSRLEAFICRL